MVFIINKPKAPNGAPPWDGLPVLMMADQKGKNMVSIYSEVINLLKNEKTKISKKALEILDKEGIANITKKNNCFWFESYYMGNDCPNYIYDYLTRFIKRKLNLKYLYE